jgi:hypothetical protein
MYLATCRYALNASRRNSIVLREARRVNVGVPLALALLVLGLALADDPDDALAFDDLAVRAALLD